MKHASILCFGDSLTAGYFANGSEFHPYAGTLQRILGRAALVEHCGLSGWTAKRQCL
jgi:lysophospholipase L1-like esterase